MIDNDESTTAEAMTINKNQFKEYIIIIRHYTQLIPCMERSANFVGPGLFNKR